MDNIPNTTNYLYLGLGVTAVIVFGYIGALLMRFRSTQKDAELLENLAEDE
jgi:hypothetical protein